MNEDRSRQIAELFRLAADLEPSARSAYLEQACAGNAELRREVESLLAFDDDGTDVFSDGKVEVTRRLLARAVKDAPRGSETNSDVAIPAPFPEQIGRYRLIEKLGEGGMGTVYLAEQDHLKRRVALKMIRPGLLSPNLLRRFRFETEALGRLQHPGIAQIYEAGESDAAGGRQPYFAMEYVEGVELRAYAREESLGLRARLELVARTCDAVHHAHQQGIIHRDLKPDNILVVAGPPAPDVASVAEFAHLGQPKILDFGVARATDADVQMTTLRTDVGQLVGTLTYMSPEVVAGDPSLLDTRSDIYALGVILYELLAGRPPFDLRSRPIPAAVRIIREDDPPRLSDAGVALRGDVNTIVTKAMEKDRERRYQSVAELAADIRRHLANEPIAAHPPSSFYQLGKFARRNRGLVAGLCVALVILMAGTAISVVFGLWAMRGERLAQRSAHRLQITTAAAIGETDPLGAMACLDAIPPEARGWEWLHLRARFVSHLAEWTGDGDGQSGGTFANCGDGTLIAALQREDRIEVIDLGSNDVRATFQAPGGVTSPCLSPDGTFLAAVTSKQGELVVWNVASEEGVLRHALEEGGAQLLSFSHDGSVLAIATQHRGTWLVEIGTGEVRILAPPEIRGARRVAFDPSGPRVAMAGRSGSTHSVIHLHVYALSGEVLRSKYLPDGCLSLAYSPDGESLAVGQEQRMIRILDAATLEERLVLRGHTAPVISLAFSPDGNELGSAGLDSSVRIWELASGNTIRILAAARMAGIRRSVVFSADGELLACGNASHVRLWRPAQSKSRSLRGHSSYVYRVTFTPDPAVPPVLASGSHLGEMCLWDACTGVLLAELPAAHPHQFLSFSPDGARLLVSDPRPDGNQREIAVWDTAAGLRVDASGTAFDQRSFDLAHYPFRFAAGNAKCGRSAGEATASSYDATLVAKGLKSGEILIDDLHTGERLKTLGPHDVEVFAVAFDPAQTRVIAGDKRGMLRVWDLATEAEVASVEGHSDRVYSVCWSPDGSRVASGGNDNKVVLWDGENLERLLVLHGHASYVHSVCFSPEGTMLATGSGDGTIRIWDSVLPAERWRQASEALGLRREAELLVERLLAELGDPLDVADYLRGDESLSDSLRHQAKIALLSARRLETHRD